MNDASAWLQLESGRLFYEGLLDREEPCRWRAEDVILLMAGECDLILLDHPNAYGYQGLTQIGVNELASLGWKTITMGPFCLAPPHVQLEYTGRYFNYWRRRYGIERWDSAGHLESANLAPAHLLRVDGVVYSQMQHQAQYRANRWLDLNKDGVITRDELTKALLTQSVPRCQARYDLALANLAKVRAERDPRPPRDYTENVQPAVVITLPRRGPGGPPEAA